MKNRLVEKASNLLKENGYKLVKCNSKVLKEARDESLENIIKIGDDEKTLQEWIEEYGMQFCSDKEIDTELFDMDMFNEMFTNTDPIDIVKRVFYGGRYNKHRDANNNVGNEFNPNDAYFYYNGYANCVSLESYYLADYLNDYIDKNAFIEYIKEKLGIEEDED